MLRACLLRMTRDVDASDLIKNSKCRVVIANPRQPCNLVNTQEKSKKIKRKKIIKKGK